jgi:hypothetical protein
VLELADDGPDLAVDEVADEPDDLALRSGQLRRAHRASSSLPSGHRGCIVIIIAARC